MKDGFKFTAGAYTYTLSRAPSALVKPLVKRHHVVVLDRSGSMCGDIDAVRSVVLKLAVADEFRDPGTLLSVVSYSGSGDAVTHLARVAVGSMDTARLAAALAELRATGLTCVSGGLSAALGLLADGECGVVTLHSDGYANDPSQRSEQAACLKLVHAVVGRGGVVNAVAHRHSADFAFLAAVANAGGGTCAQVGDLRTLHDALWSAHRSATGQQLTEQRTADCDFVLRIGAGRVALAAHVGGTVTYAADPGDEVWMVWRHEASALGTRQQPTVAKTYAWARWVALALARGMIGLGLVSTAKRVVAWTATAALAKHARALTAPEVASLAADLDAIVAAGANAPLPQGAPQADRCGVTLPELLAAVARERGRVQVNVPLSSAGYVRRGLKRVPGSWVGGELVKPAVEAVPSRTGTPTAGWADVVSADQNRQSATVTLTLSEPVYLTVAGQGRPAELVGDAAPVSAVRLADAGGVSLEHLKQYRSFAVLADGELALPTLWIRVVDRGAWSRLLPTLRPGLSGESEEFHPAPVRVDLSAFPTVRDADAACPTVEQVSRVLRLTVLQRMLAASLAGAEHATLSAEQVAALRAVHVTPAMYFSPPTTYAHRDVKAALAAGEVDARRRYSVAFWAQGIRGVDDLYSGNEYAARRFARADGTPATCADLFDPRAGVVERELSSRVKLGPVDALSMDVYQRRDERDWPGLNLAAAPWSDPAARREALAVVEAALDEAWAALTDATFAVGAAGVVPESWGPAMGAEDAEKTLGYKVPKAQRDGQFYHVGGVVAVVSSEECLYTV